MDNINHYDMDNFGFRTQFIGRKQINNNNNKTQFFNSNEHYDNFIAFSFSSLKVYNKQDSLLPNCSIYYDLNKKCLQGNEICNNSKYQINGTPEFVISQFEVYEII